MGKLKIGIAFAGGGVRGAAHLGILQALEEEGIQADYYAGTSAGSIIAVMKALGHTNKTCLEMIESARDGLLDVAYWDIIKSMPGKFRKLDSILKGNKLKNFLSAYMEQAYLADVTRDVSVISTDINTGSQVIFSSSYISKELLSGIDDEVKFYCRHTELSLSKMVYASCAVPGIFKPLEYEDMTLIDGSLTNNLPANVLKAMGADIVIAMDLSKRNPNATKVEGFFNVMGQSVGVLVGQNTYLATHKLDNVYRLNPDLTSVGLLDFSKIMDCYERGYEYGKNVASFIKESIDKESLK